MNIITINSILCNCSEWVFHLAYPFTGRMVLFTGDGHSGITLDGGATWQRFDMPPHSLQSGDVDWGSHTLRLGPDSQPFVCHHGTERPAAAIEMTYKG